MEFHLSHQICAATNKCGGFGIFYQSQDPSLSEAKQSIARNGTYNPPSFEGSVEVKDYPINFAHYTVEDSEHRQRPVLLFSKYTGATNHTPDRPGNYITHSVVFSESIDGFSIPQLFECIPFRKSLTIEEESTFVPPAETLLCEPDDLMPDIPKALRFLQTRQGLLNAFLEIVDCIISGWIEDKSHSIVINSSTNQESIGLIFALYSILPSTTINGYSFATFISNPSTVPFQICGVVPECKATRLDPTYFKVLETGDDSKLYQPINSITRFLNECIATANADNVKALSNLLGKYGINHLDRRAELPFLIRDFKQHISEKTLDDLNHVLSIFSPRQSEHKKALVEFVSTTNPGLFFEYSKQEVGDELSQADSLTSQINIIEGYLRRLSNLVDKEQLLAFYAIAEGSMSKPAIIAVNLLTDYEDIKRICLSNTALLNHLLETIDKNWNSILKTEVFLNFIRYYQNYLISDNCPRARQWIITNKMKNAINNGTFLSDFEQFNNYFKQLDEQQKLNIVIQFIQTENNKGLLTPESFKQIVDLVNQNVSTPAFFWKNYFGTHNDEFAKEGDQPNYTDFWQSSMLKRYLVVFSPIEQWIAYKDIIDGFDEFDVRWMLEKFIETHNAEAYRKFATMAPKKRRGLWRSWS